MRKFYFLVLLLLLLQKNSPSQQNEYMSLVKGFISVGYSNAMPDNVDEYYNSIINSYKSAGVPIPTQTKFGKTFVVNGGILLTRLESIWFGLSLGYFYSPAYSSYRDKAGTLKVNGNVNSYEVALKIKTTLFKIDDLYLNASAQPGLAYTTSYLTEELRYIDIPQANYDNKWSVHAWGPSFQVTFCPQVQLGIFDLSLEGGYRIFWNKVIDEKIESISLNRELHKPLDINYSGFVFLVTLEINL